LYSLLLQLLGAVDSSDGFSGTGLGSSLSSPPSQQGSSKGSTCSQQLPAWHRPHLQGDDRQSGSSLVPTSVHNAYCYDKAEQASTVEMALTGAMGAAAGCAALAATVGALNICIVAAVM